MQSIKNKRVFANTKSGFTLIETLLYIVLFSIIIGGGFVAVYQIIAGSRASQTKAIIEAEGNFVLRKIDWALNGSSIISPINSLSNTLEINRQGTTLGFSPLGEQVILEISGNSYELTSNRIKVTNLEFIHDSGPPASITTTFQLNGHEFGPKIRYVR